MAQYSNDSVDLFDKNSISPLNEVLKSNAAAGPTARTASGFSGGFTVSSYSEFGGAAYEHIRADDFRIEHPEFVTFYKDRKQVAVRRISTIKAIDAR